MKFRDPKTGKVFKNIYSVVYANCAGKYCRECKLHDLSCHEWPYDHTIEAARLMGYEVIEDEKNCVVCAYSANKPYENPCNECNDHDKFELKDVNMEIGNKPISADPQEYYDMSDEPVPSVSSHVNHPAHYNQGGVECIDALKAATVGLEGIQAFCAANAIKYIWRFKDKNGAEDLDKAMWYIQRLKEEIRNG